MSGPRPSLTSPGEGGGGYDIHAQPAGAGTAAARTGDGDHPSRVILVAFAAQRITGEAPAAGRRSAMPSGSDDVIRHYDVVVIGAGPAGEAAAELGANLGYQVALVERDTVGGTASGRTWPGSGGRCRRASARPTRPGTRLATASHPGGTGTWARAWSDRGPANTQSSSCSRTVSRWCNGMVSNSSIGTTPLRLCFGFASASRGLAPTSPRRERAGWSRCWRAATGPSSPSMGGFGGSLEGDRLQGSFLPLDQARGLAYG
jgi:hypothetical protein